MYSWWKPSTVVTISRFGFVFSIISSKFVKVGQLGTPMKSRATTARLAFVSQSPTNSRTSGYILTRSRPHMPLARSPVPTMA